MPDRVTMPCSRFSTLTCSLTDRNMVDPACGPCHACHVSGRTVQVLVSGSWPLVDQLERHLGGHHLGHRRRRHALVGVLGQQHRPRRQVDQISDRRRRIDIAAPWPERRWRGRQWRRWRAGLGGSWRMTLDWRMTGFLYRPDCALRERLQRRRRSRRPAGRPTARNNSSNYNRGSPGNCWSADRPSRRGRPARARSPAHCPGSAGRRRASRRASAIRPSSASGCGADRPRAHLGGDSIERIAARLSVGGVRTAIPHGIPRFHPASRK